jgi:hypothetical protein
MKGVSPTLPAYGCPFEYGSAKSAASAFEIYKQIPNLKYYNKWSRIVMFVNIDNSEHYVDALSFS